MSTRMMGWPAVVFFLTIVFVGALFFYSKIQMEWQIRVCATLAPPRQPNCISALMRDELKIHGLPAAMEIFTKAFSRFPFTGTLCHPMMHRLGDEAYYQLYAAGKNVDQLTIPTSASTCGYGLIHGLIEHLIQGHPSEEFITQTCEHLRDQYEAMIPAIRSECYHGSGRGLMLARADTFPKKEWGNTAVFASQPLSVCASLSKANAEDRSMCQMGVFHALFNEVDSDRVDHAQPQKACNSISASYVPLCRYAMLLAIQELRTRDVPELLQLMKSDTTHPFSQVEFAVAVGGIVKQSLRGSAYRDVLASCSSLPTDYLHSCIDGTVESLYQHGEPGNEYQQVVALCADDSLPAAIDRGYCYGAAARNLTYLYPEEKIQKICILFPAQYRTFCTDKTFRPLKVLYRP